MRTWHASQTHRPRQANLDVAILRKAMAIALADGLITENPATGITPHPERKRDRIPSDDEMRAILNAIDTEPLRPQAALLFNLLGVTGARTGEWRTAEWSWLSADGATLNLPDAKTGARPLALSSIARALLSTAPTRGGRFIIPNDDGDGPLPSWTVNDQWEIVRRASGVRDLNVHDLRHAFATRGAGLGASAVLLRDALGHKTLAMTNRYVSRQDDPVRQLAERIGSQIESLRSNAGEVVTLRKGRPLRRGPQL